MKNARLGLVLMALSMLVVMGCGKPEKPQELKQIEALWQNPETRKVKDVPGAEKFYREARQFRYDAQEAYNDGEIETSREYAIWSNLRYRTALSVARQFEAKDKLDQANAQVAQVNPQLESINQERNKLVMEVAALERQVTMARRKKESLDRRKNAAIIAGQNAQAGEADELKRRQIVDEKIKQVETSKIAATSVNAGVHAAASYNKAENQYKSILSLRNASPLPYDAILTTADSAIRDYQTAAREAKAGFAIEMAKQNPEQRRQALLSEAQNALGAANALQEGASVRVIAPGSFDGKGTTLNGNGRRYVAAIAKMAKQFDEFSIRVEAYTNRGDATENLGVSQLRARAVEGVLKAEGVDGGRIKMKGMGQDNLRYGDSSQNDRVEVVFTR